MSLGSKERIAGLRFSPRPYEILSVTKAQNLIKIRVIAEFNRDDWSLTSTTASRLQIIHRDPKKPVYEFIFLIRAITTEAEVVAIGPMGTVETQKLIVTFRPFAKYLSGSIGAVSKPRTVFNVGLGYTSIAYRETDAANFTEKALTGKVSMSVPLWPRWSGGVSTYFTASVLQSSHPTAQIGFIGVNARVGYQLSVPAPWKLGIHFGGYFTTTTGTNNKFGFESLMGPQFYPTFGRNFGRTSVSGYLKYSPIGDGFSVMSLTNREIAFGIGLAYGLRNGNAISLNLDLANLGFTVEDVLTLTKISVSSSTSSVNLGYSF